MERGGQAYYYHYDGLGSVSDLTDENGNIVEYYNYDAYGNMEVFDEFGVVIPSEVEGSQIGNPYTFTGRRWDQESNIYHYRARQYDSMLGRFVQRDPLGNIDSENLYSYVINNPGNFSDPYGLYSMYDFLRDSSNFSAGFGDTITFGATNYLRENYIGGNESLDKCSGAYAAGGYTATGAEIALGGAGIAKVAGKAGIKTGIKGGEVVLKKSGKTTFRLAPLGNKKIPGQPNPWYRRFPHYHRRVIDPKTGKTLPGQGIGQHRPYQGGF